MKLTNESGLEAGWALGFQPDGRELLVVAVKGTWSLRNEGGPCELAPDQMPLVEADEFTGEPGLSSLRYECDYAHRKSRCDVLLNGTAYAPRGRAARRVRVSLRVGRWHKAFEVVGDREWKWIPLLGAWPGRPQPFTTMPISYDNAYGGLDDTKPNKVKTYLRNPVGRGYRPRARHASGKPLPNTQQLGKAVRSSKGAYQPMAFGPIGRAWQPRVSHAGTYDQSWIQNDAPFLPHDFDDRYFQSAPEDQQIPFPAGHEEVVLENLTPEGLIRFKLPRLSMPVLLIPVRGNEAEIDARPDTLLIEPDANRFCITWRACHPLRRNAFEIEEVVVGEMPRSWYRARRGRTKRYYSNLSDLVAEQRTAPR